ncbi:MAG: response regulator [Nitrospiraceae bacterium]|nr:response regulator [Nitrospiraceae bacterium]
MGDTRYCLCCDEEVPFSTVERNERKEVICAFCGFTLDIEKGSQTSAPEKGIALIAEDSPFTRKIIEKLIREKNFSEKVMALENGLELVSAYGKLLSEKAAVDVAIIDLNMPVMDGITAARTLRALEAQNSAQRVPIVFFSAAKADENLRQQMELLEPANYVNKGDDADPEKLITRVEMLLSYLMEKYRQPAV